jgi:hypothetical protein
MQNLLFYIFSTYECMSLFILIMAVFRFPILKNKIKIVLSCLLVTTVSLIVTKTGLHEFNIFIQIPLVVLIFRYIFKENEKYSIWISVSGYISFLMIQGVIVMLLLIYNLIQAQDIQPFTSKGYAIQAFTSTIIIVIGLFLKKYNEGFSFDFSDVFKKKRNSKSYKPYAVLAIIFFIITASTYPIFFYGSNLTNTFLVTVVLSFLSFSLLVFLSIKRNKEEFTVTQ